MTGWFPTPGFKPPGTHGESTTWLRCALRNEFPTPGFKPPGTHGESTEGVPVNNKSTEGVNPVNKSTEGVNNEKEEEQIYQRAATRVTKILLENKKKKHN